ncbi:hypothetical protein MAPG_07265 [Magnaporthiopsis poae ATCC 64411]|uniref:Uncharacterized protein n=1 Tax=Magnaporthiopsis poae (strain ATCC 64411 / 73-15) TaxID=644358 RepID=A0A0C4E476_MAGP6|nr:hypothetical protein MAPG_07265 [Magnaporthiopsis poae ATCC 64411]
MQFKTLLVVAFAGLVIATPTPQARKKTQEERVAIGRKNGLICNPSGRDDGVVLCGDGQSGETCFINKAGGGNCLF